MNRRRSPGEQGALGVLETGLTSPFLRHRKGTFEQRLEGRGCLGHTVIKGRAAQRGDKETVHASMQGRPASHAGGGTARGPERPEWTEGRGPTRNEVVRAQRDKTASSLQVSQGTVIARAAGGNGEVRGAQLLDTS